MHPGGAPRSHRCASSFDQPVGSLNTAPLAPDTRGISPSSLRELMPSLVKTLRRWYSTVRGLMNSRAPISGFVWPVAGEPGDLRLLRREVVARLRRCACATVSPVASELAAGALGERLGADAAEHLVGGAQLLARVHAPVLAAQPLAVEQLGAGEVDGDPGARRAARSPRGRAPRRLAVAEQRARAGLDPERPVGAARAAFARRAARGRRRRLVGLPAAGRRLDQLGERPARRGPDRRARTPAGRRRAASS